jgi:hypothetical protein
MQLDKYLEFDRGNILHNGYINHHHHHQYYNQYYNGRCGREKRRRIWFQPVASKVRWMFEIYDLVRMVHFVECPQGSHMAKI